MENGLLWLVLYNTFIKIIENRLVFYSKIIKNGLVWWPAPKSNTLTPIFLPPSPLSLSLLISKKNYYIIYIEKEI